MTGRKNKLVIFSILSVIIVTAIAAVLILSKGREKPVKILYTYVPKTKIAIVIDDIGYSQRNLSRLYGIKEPLTLSILPNAPYSNKIAQEAPQNGYEVILHLPLEPCDKTGALEADTICTEMSEAEVLDKLAKCFSSVPTLKGVSNHMGSEATADKKVMSVIFRELKKRKLFFLDSFVTENSICEAEAQHRGIKFIKRDIFLDNTPDARYIKNQLNVLIEEAKRKGYAVGIGHDRQITIEVLAAEMPKLAAQDIEFVFVSELAR